jgi:CubicO group peptidase (beta-lactamase class C family)
MTISQALEIADEWVSDRVVPGLAVVVGQHGRLLGEYYGGRQAAGGGDPVDASTLYSIASITKVYTAAAFMRLVDRGVVGLDEPVRRAVPAFSGADKRGISFRELLCHTSGMPKDDPHDTALWHAEAGFGQIANSAAALPLAAPPNQRVIYSNAAYWVLGAAISAIAGLTFPEALAADILNPFGLHASFITPPLTEYDRIARRYGRAKIMNTAYGRNLGSPSAGLFATARDLARFASFFLSSSHLNDGLKALSSASINEMTLNQTDTLPGGIEGVRVWARCAWSLGWEVKGDKLNHWTGDLTSPATVSHIGQSGALLWVDPTTGIACAILANRDLATGWTETPARWARLNNAIVAALAGDDTV